MDLVTEYLSTILYESYIEGGKVKSHDTGGRKSARPVYVQGPGKELEDARKKLAKLKYTQQQAKNRQNSLSKNNPQRHNIQSVISNYQDEIEIQSDKIADLKKKFKQMYKKKPEPTKQSISSKVKKFAKDNPNVIKGAKYAGGAALAALGAYALYKKYRKWKEEKEMAKTAERKAKASMEMDKLKKKIDELKKKNKKKG